MNTAAKRSDGSRAAARFGSSRRGKVLHIKNGTVL